MTALTNKQIERYTQVLVDEAHNVPNPIDKQEPFDTFYRRYNAACATAVAVAAREDLIAEMIADYRKGDADKYVIWGDIIDWCKSFLPADPANTDGGMRDEHETRDQRRGS